jgi:uncharacterized membrane protein YphA (DoxX/SURF4 family)
MEFLVIGSSVVIAIGLLNVWILRPGKPTAWRGQNAQTLREEFATYGLPPWSVSAVGMAKITLSILLLAGIWWPAVSRPAAIGTAVLMLGAVSMHLKVRDPIKKSLPALALLGLSCLVVFL